MYAVDLPVELHRKGQTGIVSITDFYDTDCNKLMRITAYQLGALVFGARSYPDGFRYSIEYPKLMLHKSEDQDATSEFIGLQDVLFDLIKEFRVCSGYSDLTLIDFILKTGGITMRDEARLTTDR